MKEKQNTTPPRRRSIRLPRYDYTSPGAYFVTICTQDGACLFNNPTYHQVVEHAWHSIPTHFAHTQLDEFVVMPNHVHGIIWITGRGEASQGDIQKQTKSIESRCLAPTLVPGSLGAIIGNFKSVTARRMNGIRKSPGMPVWQRNYYEHVVRNEMELQRIREYIAMNPLQWEYDRENPAHRMAEEYRRQWGWIEKPI